jgi:hypothetical protein
MLTCCITQVWLDSGSGRLQRTKPTPGQRRDVRDISACTASLACPCRWTVLQLHARGCPLCHRASAWCVGLGQTKLQAPVAPQPHTIVMHARRLKALANENSLPESVLVDSPIPLRVVDLQPEDEQEFLSSAAALDLGQGNIANPVAYLMKLISSIRSGPRRKAVVPRCSLCV